MNIGNQISKRRKELDLTQQELADQLFVSVKTVSKWETNKGNPEVSLIPKIAKILKIDVNDFFNESEEEIVETVEEEKVVVLREKNIKLIVCNYLIFLFAMICMFIPCLSISTAYVRVRFNGWNLLFQAGSYNFGNILVLFLFWLFFLEIICYAIFPTLELFVKSEEILEKKDLVQKWMPYISFITILLFTFFSIFIGIIEIGVLFFCILFGGLFFYVFFKRRKNVNTN